VGWKKTRGRRGGGGGGGGGEGGVGGATLKRNWLREWAFTFSAVGGCSGIKGCSITCLRVYLSLKDDTSSRTSLLVFLVVSLFALLENRLPGKER